MLLNLILEKKIQFRIHDVFPFANAGLTPGCLNLFVTILITVQAGKESNIHMKSRV